MVLFYTTFLIPKIGAQLVAAKQELPWITKQLMNVSYIMTSWWVLLVIAVLAAIVITPRRFLKT